MRPLLERGVRPLQCMTNGDVAALACSGTCAYLGGLMMTGLYGWFVPVDGAQYMTGFALMIVSACLLAWILAGAPEDA